MREVIVGIHRSHPSSSTVAMAALAAEDRRTSLHVVMSAPRPTIEAGDTARRDLIDAEHFLLPFVRGLTAIEFTWMVGIGDLEPMLVEEARRLRAVLVVIADGDACQLIVPGIAVLRVPVADEPDPTHDRDVNGGR